VKPWISVVIAAAMTAFSVGCDGPTEPVGLFVYNMDDPYIRGFTEFLVAEADDRFSLEIEDAGNSQIIQNEQIERRLASGLSLAIVNPVDRLGAFSIIETLRREGVPIIFFNREPLRRDLDLWDQTYYVGAKAAQSGEMQARLVMDLFGGDPRNLNSFDRNGDNVIQAVLLKGEQGHQDAEARTREGLRSFEDAGFAVEILALEVANWNRNQAYDLMGPIISELGGRMELVLSNNDAMALGAINRMRQSGMFLDSNENGRIDPGDETWLPVVGIDALPEAEAMIRNGFLYGTVFNDSSTQARAIVDLTQAILSNRSLESLEFRVEEGKYVWIDYRPVVLE
jgi:methyl-galactoside transport system substrate-binding protein